MKKIIIITLMTMLLGICSYSQTSDFNKNTKFLTESSDEWGRWFKETDGSEVLLYEQTPVGYHKILLKLADIFSFYKLDEIALVTNEVIIERGVDVKDFASVSNSLLRGESSIVKKWESNNIILIIICDSNTNGILLKQK